MSVNCIGYVYLMPIVALEFSFLLHKHKLNIFLLILEVFAGRAANTQPLGRKKMPCPTQQRPLCSIKVPYKAAAL